MTYTVIQYPVTQKIGQYDVLVYPMGCSAQLHAMVYLRRTHQAIWETLPHDTINEAIEDARQLIEHNTAYCIVRS
jgi:hypothetical protein